MQAARWPDAHLVETRLDSVEILKGSFLHAMRDTVGCLTAARQHANM
jgi:ADP-ribose pyrophosphatase